MNDSGWKVDTGHKSGYLSFIEKELAKRLPNAHIKADPHIQSKVKTLKKLLSYILDIQQSGSGFGWDDERKMVVGDKDQFMGWAKSRPGAAALYGKPFVNFDKLFEIYASDLAKGAKAKGPGDQFDLHEELSSADVTEQTQQIDSAVDSHSQPPCHGSYSSSGVKSLAGRKRVILDDNVLASEFSNISKALNTLVEAETANAAAMNAMQSAFTLEFEAQKRTDERREQLFSVLKKLSGFSRDQIVKAVLVIGQNEKRINLLFTTPDELKSEFVHQVLKRPKKI
uniref:Myb/SANT-like domain-containing protein n=1 Tax=Setaria italica TaxID=4555 RepID=K3XKR5_SETIT